MHNRYMKILVLAPHADDETLGMGGTIFLKREQGHKVFVAILTGHGGGKHPIWSPEHWEKVRAEARQAATILNISKLIFKELPSACLDNLPNWQINEVVSNLIQEIEPEELYIPFSYDLHKDHNAISYAARVAARPYLDNSRFIKRILAYEILSETHLNYSNINESFEPNVFVNISKTLEKKLEAMKKYKSQLQQKSKPRSLESIKALATLRGSHIGCSAAEAFLLLGEFIR